MKDLIACLDQRQLAKNPQVWGGVGAGVGVGGASIQSGGRNKYVQNTEGTSQHGL